MSNQVSREIVLVSGPGGRWRDVRIQKIREMARLGIKIEREGEENNGGIKEGELEDTAKGVGL